MMIFKKIREFFSNKENLPVILILVGFLILNIIFFTNTYNQPLWWDEADYANIAHSWVGDYNWKFNPLRPILFPLLFSGFLSLGLGLTSMKLLVLVLSFFSLIFFYKVAKILFNKKIAIYSLICFGFFWSYLFYSHRLLVDVPLTFLWLGTIYFFLDSYYNNRGSQGFIFAGIFLGLSFLMKFSSGIMIILFAVFITYSERIKIFKKKEIYSFYLTSLTVVTPYLIWLKVKYGSFLAFYNYARGEESNFVQAHTFSESLLDQTFFSIKLIDPSLLNQKIFGIPLEITLFIIGLSSAILLISLLPEKMKSKGTKQNKIIFVLLWIILSLLFFGWVNYGDYMDERYYFVFYPAIFMLCGFGISKIEDLSKFYNPNLSKVIVFIIISLILIQNIIHASTIIGLKESSYTEFKLAGQFLRENVGEERIVLVNEEMAEYVYYSRRDVNYDGTIHNVTDLYEKIESLNPEYMAISFYFYLNGMNEARISVVNEVFKSDKFTLVKQFGPPVDKEGRVRLVNVFKVNY